MIDKVAAKMNMIFGGWAYLELLDELTGTDAYRQAIKTRVNALMPHLEKGLDEDLARFWGTEGEEIDRVIYRIMDGWKGLFTKFREVKPDYIPALDEISQMMVTDPEFLLDIINKHWRERSEEEKSKVAKMIAV